MRALVLHLFTREQKKLIVQAMSLLFHCLNCEVLSFTTLPELRDHFITKQVLNLLKSVLKQENLTYIIVHISMKGNYITEVN